ncbi:hypothetical protein, partial [Bacillus toyonensis]|uniref:hypothetical protein n=1 Tax=Bacillus toyonensis TaxID=155322 RepID=UPI001C557944
LSKRFLLAVSNCYRVNNHMIRMFHLAKRMTFMIKLIARYGLFFLLSVLTGICEGKLENQNIKPLKS